MFAAFDRKQEHVSSETRRLRAYIADQHYHPPNSARPTVEWRGDTRPVDASTFENVYATNSAEKIPVKSASGLERANGIGS